MIKKNMKRINDMLNDEGNWSAFLYGTAIGILAGIAICSLFMK